MMKPLKMILLNRGGSYLMKRFKKSKYDMNYFQEVTSTKVIQDQEGSEKASDEVSTAGAKKGTASEKVPRVSTAESSIRGDGNSASRPEGFDLMLWGDLHTLFEPDEDDEIWKDQHEYNLLSWRLYDFSGIHILLMENGLAIHMLTKKKYPLSQEMLTKISDIIVERISAEEKTREFNQKKT
ncbi:hypothetical protein Tco_0787634 [Tanacetum coccineum]